jgi:phosphate/sulfate permease
VPVSTTHTITGAIYGVGSARSASAVIAAVFYVISTWAF